MQLDDIGAFLGYWRRIRARTVRVALCIPPDRIEWTHREGAFTFGDLLRHLAATERYMFAENACLRPSRYPGHGPELAEGYDAVLAYLAERHEQTLEILRELSSEDLQRRCVTPGNAEIPVWKWLRSMVEHEVHHRAQIYLMLGMLGVPTPPLYGLTEQEVRAASIDFAP